MAAEKKYQIIPRKYRPQTFALVVGQEAIVSTLKNALRMQRLAHAYLFCGSRGTGKTTLARLFAKALNCKELTPSQEPCNQCPSCLEITSGKSLDVLEIDGASSRGIDDIRQINETIGYAPASGKYKIYIIDEVHMLTKEAFNALLKTLEEPPANVKFFFATTEPHKVLPTIVSRCQRFDLHRIASDVMQAKLASIAQDLQVEIAKDAIALITQVAEGSLRDAESLLDQIICYAKSPISQEDVANALGLLPQATFFALDEAIHAGDLSFAFRLSSEIFSAGKDIPYFLEGLLEHYRILLLFTLGTPPSALPEKERFQKSASYYTDEHCLYILDFLMHWVQQIGKNPFKRISLEMILLHLIRSKHRVSMPSLVKRLAELEKGLDQDELQTESKRTESSIQVPVPALTMPIQTITPPAEEKIEPVSSRPVEIIEKEEIVAAASEPPKPIPAPVQEEKAAQAIPKEEKTVEQVLASKEPVVSPSLEKKAEQPIAAEEKSVEQVPASKEPVVSPSLEETIDADPIDVASDAYADEELSLFQEETNPALEEPIATALNDTLGELISSKQAAQSPAKERSSLFEEAPAVEKKQDASSVKNTNKEQSKLDTLIRFAAVELEGIVKND